LSDLVISAMQSVQNAKLTGSEVEWIQERNTQ